MCPSIPKPDPLLFEWLSNLMKKGQSGVNPWNWTAWAMKIDPLAEHVLLQMDGEINTLELSVCALYRGPPRYISVAALLHLKRIHSRLNRLPQPWAFSSSFL